MLTYCIAGHGLHLFLAAFTEIVQKYTCGGNSMIISLFFKTHLECIIEFTKTDTEFSFTTIQHYSWQY
jgi:hypothetical protein